MQENKLFHLYDYNEVLATFQKKTTDTVHLLLGNGFSIDCDELFAYPNLFKYACKHGLSKRAQRLFQRLGTNNFEGALRMLDDTIWAAREYGVTDEQLLGLMQQ